MTAMAQGPASVDGQARRAAIALERGLPLVWLAAVCGVVDLGWNRIAVVALDGMGQTDVALWLLRTGPFWRNLAAVSGLVALTTGFVTYFRMAGFAAPLRRVQVAGLAGLLLSGLALSMALAKESLPSVVVLLAVGVGNALVVLFGVTAGGYFRSPYRAGVWGAALASVLVLVLLVAASLESLQLWLSDGESLASRITWGSMIACRVGGELVWLATPLVVARWLMPELRGGTSRSLAIVVVAVILSVTLLGERLDASHASVLAYGAFRLTLLPEALVGLYAVPLSAAVGIGVSALATGSPAARQVGAYLLLWVAAGFAPRTPIQILYLVLSVVSIARAVQASDPDGRRRASLSWGEPIEPPAARPVRPPSSPPPAPPSADEPAAAPAAASPPAP